ncbi:hypothetical protein BpPP18_14890 [Weizmannia acidilactici]|nr:hypothetical protein BpPP18_14890 [Weizmannia acidilactici]
MTKTSKKDHRMKARKGKSEHFTRREIEELMGINRPVYERRRGAIKRKN